MHILQYNQTDSHSRAKYFVAYIFFMQCQTENKWQNDPVLWFLSYTIHKEEKKNQGISNHPKKRKENCSHNSWRGGCTNKNINNLFPRLPFKYQKSRKPRNAKSDIYGALDQNKRVCEATLWVNKFKIQSLSLKKKNSQSLPSEKLLI